MHEHHILSLLADVGGSWAPDENTVSPQRIRELRTLVNKGRISAEDVGGLVRYSLTELGREEATSLFY